MGCRRSNERSTDGTRQGEIHGADNFWSAAFAIATGDEPTANPDQIATRTRYSAIVTLQPTERIEYVFHQHYAYQEDGRLNGGIARWYGIDNYLYYKITDQLITSGNPFFMHRAISTHGRRRFSAAHRPYNQTACETATRHGLQCSRTHVIVWTSIFRLPRHLPLDPTRDSHLPF